MDIYVYHDDYDDVNSQHACLDACISTSGNKWRIMMEVECLNTKISEYLSRVKI